MEEVIVKEPIKNNYIGCFVFFQHSTLGRIKGIVIDQDETGYSISSHGVIWNVDPSQQLEIILKRSKKILKKIVK